MEAQIVEQLYKLVVKGIPVSFEPSGTAGLWVLEEANSLKTGTLNCTEWIKPPEKRHPRQCTAFLLLTISSIEQANQVLKGLTVIGWCVLVWHGLIEPRCCAKCQSNDGHSTQLCTYGHHSCATCARAHPTTRRTQTATTAPVGMYLGMQPGMTAAQCCMLRYGLTLSVMLTAVLGSL